MRNWQIYALEDPDTKQVRYVGITFRPRRRIVEHLSRARKGGRTHRDCWIRSLLARALVPVVHCLEAGTGDWRAAERRWIALYRTTGALVNHTDGGEGTPGYVPTPELRAKWSVVRRGRNYQPGRIRPMLGKSHSPEARAKIAAAGFGRRHSPSSKAKLSVAHLGKTISAEARAKMSSAKKGCPLSAEHKAKIAASSASSMQPVVCVETGEIYRSIKAAGLALGVNPQSIRQALRNGGRCRGTHWRPANPTA